MRDRHFTRLCRSCTAPVGRQEDACWSCGADWSTPAPPHREGGRRAPDLQRPAHVTVARRADEHMAREKPPARAVVGAARQ